MTLSAENNSSVENAWGLSAENNSISTTNTGEDINVDIKADNSVISIARAIYSQEESQINVNTDKNININMEGKNNGVIRDANGIFTFTNAEVNITKAKDVNITAEMADSDRGNRDDWINGIYSFDGAINITNTSNLNIKMNAVSQTVQGIIAAAYNEDGVDTINVENMDIGLNITDGNNTFDASGIRSISMGNGKKSLVDINTVKSSIAVSTSNAYKTKGIENFTYTYSQGAPLSEMDIKSDYLNIDVKADGGNALGISTYNMGSDENSLNSGKANTAIEVNGDVNITVMNTGGTAIGVSVKNTDNVTDNATAVLNIATAGSNTVKATDTGIASDGKGAYANISSKQGKNTVSVDKKTALKALNGGRVNLKAELENKIIGTIHSEGEGSSVELYGNGDNTVIVNEANTLGETDIVSAVYVADGGIVNINADEGETNRITEENLSSDKKGRLVLANAGIVNLNGKGILRSGQIALAAGVSEAAAATDKKAAINFNYGEGSDITGDIVAGKNGTITVTPRIAAQSGGLSLKGNIMAANGGAVNVNIGKDTVFAGRTDDFSDIAVNANHGTDIFKQDYSDYIVEKGNIYLTLGDNSRWNVSGQSWVTQLDTSGAVIDLVKVNTDRNTNSHALTVGTLKGDATFNMSLDRNRDISDMVYVKKADGVYNINVVDPVTTDDMYANDFNGLRFATVGKGSNVQFRAYTVDAGVMNVEYEVGSDEYGGNKENDAYNGGKDINEDKPGSRGVDEFFAKEDNTVSGERVRRPRSVPNDGLAGESENAGENDNEKNNGSEDKLKGVTNYKLIARKENPDEHDKPKTGDTISEKNLSDAGKTILNMAKANYNRAVYMDTLNKRQGEARYIDGDEGLWVRLRHDRTDKKTGYKISSNMYELGYDKKYESKDGNGYHRRGVAIDYMDGDTSYDDIAGSGETNRKGIWVYDTWFGNKGHYTDYIAKWGHLENSFDLYTKTRGEKVSGEYNNNVYSLSAEWGYKDILNEDKENPENNRDKWYIEPQLQMQYARVTGADYMTSQGTDVSVDGIDSLIARAGFRLGKDFGDDRKSTFYVKADVLHEFLGDQDITVKDKTTDGIARTIGYDNDGTWYTVGLGFSTMLSDHSYAFLDVEKLFGNDNDNSYQINGGVQWAL